MTELQKKELELLEIFIKICEQLGLQYYLVCGTALGAAKYEGFIPWDDDIDVALPRRDYEEFLKRADEFLSENLFLQNYRTDPFFPHVYTKLRDSSTTYIEKDMAHLNINHGIAIDIFPLDGYPKSKVSRLMLRYRKKFLSWQFYCGLGDEAQPFKVRLRNRVFRLFGYHKRTAKSLGRLDKLISKYPTHTSEIWCNHGNWQGEREYAPHWHYGNGEIKIFEGIKAVIPENYDAYLTQKYEDWQKELPVNKQKSHHNILIFDTNRSYNDYRMPKH